MVTDAELAFWIVALIGAIVFVVWAIHKANKENYVTWVTEEQDKY